MEVNHFSLGKKKRDLALSSPASPSNWQEGCQRSRDGCRRFVLAGDLPMEELQTLRLNKVLGSIDREEEDEVLMDLGFGFSGFSLLRLGS